MGWWERFRQFCEDMDPERDPRDGHYAGQLLWARGRKEHGEMDGIRTQGGWTYQFAEGQRTITEHRECEENHRWQGVIDNPGYPGRVWRGWGAGDVIRDMDRDLGPIPESDYRIVE